MAHLNIYLSKERTDWLRKGLEKIARQQNRSLSYVVEEALVEFVRASGERVPKERRKDHRHSAAR